ncbi:MAG: hypothetical protein LBJ11_02925 [Oscillospiraceae bacterium]|jgi:hypothetical protein|nr:hypothetical protein [Oscillospiraceae bacterium]
MKRTFALLLALTLLCSLAACAPSAGQTNALVFEEDKGITADEAARFLHVYEVDDLAKAVAEIFFSASADALPDNLCASAISAVDIEATRNTLRILGTGGYMVFDPVSYWGEDLLGKQIVEKFGTLEEVYKQLNGSAPVLRDEKTLLLYYVLSTAFDSSSFPPPDPGITRYCLKAKGYIELTTNPKTQRCCVSDVDFIDTSMADPLQFVLLGE